jgi:hypothetical protein
MPVIWATGEMEKIAEAESTRPYLKKKKISTKGLVWGGLKW